MLSGARAQFVYANRESRDENRVAVAIAVGTINESVRRRLRLICATINQSVNQTIAQSINKRIHNGAKSINHAPSSMKLSQPVSGLTFNLKSKWKWKLKLKLKLKWKRT